MPVSYIQTEESFLFEEMLRLEYALMTQYIQLCHVVGDAEFLKTMLDQKITSYFEVKKEIENRSPVKN